MSAHDRRPQVVVPSHIFHDLEPERAVLAPRGIDVVDGSALDPEACRAAVREADALLCSCTAWRSVEAVAELERRTGKPVVTSNQASIWASFRALGLRPPLKGFGGLLQELAA